MMDNVIARSQVVEEAHTWLRTPYHHNQHVKGAGVDCVWLLIEVYKTIGVVPVDFETGFYTHDWFLHRREELYLEGVKKYAHPLPEDRKPLPGDIAMYKIGYTVSHGSIIVSPNLIIHAYRKANQVEIAEMDKELAPYFHSYWTPFK